ncbi:beta strand repeat-containing protein, partial [Flavobacterium sp. RSB2_4_14]|uniref:beta strand repeat-containing protein n=1 Tax=Flavobacterium sp. RSB2_4_14 TaxID=3447665 RepID=UPI003F2BA3A1
MKKYYFLLTLFFTVLVSAQPVITTFSPATGAIGSSVIITGTGFNTTAAQNIVFFGATRATVTSASSTSLTVMVPLGATYKNISVTNLAVNLTGYSLKPFIVTLVGSTKFVPKVDFAVGSSPKSVSIGDVDGDGKPEIVVADNGSNTVSILLNISSTSATSFATKFDLPFIGFNLSSVCLGDINGDGKLDLAVTNGDSYYGYGVSIFINTSTIGIVSFSAIGKWPTASFPSDVSIGDINGDGKPDLAVVSGLNSIISLLRNTSTVGGVSFATKVDFATGSGPNSVSIGDIDGNGKPDLATANSSGSTVSVLRNTSTLSTVSFATKVDFTTGTNPTSVSLGDIDGDGKPDLALTNVSSNTVSVLRNTSVSGTVSFAVKVDFATGSLPTSVTIGDIDGDGKPDLAVTNQGINTISVMRNTSISGTASFAANVGYTTGSTPNSVSIGDIDGDGKPDLAVTNAGNNTVSIIGQVPPVTVTTFSPASGAIGSSVTITGTGFDPTSAQNIVYFGATKATVTAATATSLTVMVPLGATYQNISITNLAVNLTGYSAKPFIVTLDGNIAFANKLDFAAGTNSKSVSIGDIDGDGKADLAVTNRNSATISIYRNTSTSGTVSYANKVDFATGDRPNNVRIGDIDGDGKSDLVLVNDSSDTVTVLRNTSTIGLVNFAAKNDFITGDNPTSVYIADINGDGKPDLAVTNGFSDSVSLFRNNSTSGIVNFAVKVDFSVGVTPNSVAIGDIDNDGKPDLAIVNSNSSTISILRNTSSIAIFSFAVKVDFVTGATAFSVAMGDIDGDGKPDLAVRNGGGASILRNTSTTGIISFAAKVDFTASTAYDLSLGDINGDGKPDLAVFNYSVSTVSVFRNTSTSGTVTFATKVDFPVSSGPFSGSIGDIDGDGKPDIVTVSSFYVSVLRQLDLPQGSLLSSGALCTSEIGQLIFQATSGTGPFTVVYNDGTADRTATGVVSGTPFSVFTNPVTSTTSYTLVSVSYPNNAIRTTGFTGALATITVNPNTTPTVTLTSSDGDNTFAYGTPVTFTATEANIAGGTVSYDFRVNGTSVQNGASNTYAVSNLANGNQVSVVITVTGGTCLTTSTVTS